MLMTAGHDYVHIREAAQLQWGVCILESQYTTRETSIHSKLQQPSCSSRLVIMQDISNSFTITFPVRVILPPGTTCPLLSHQQI